MTETEIQLNMGFKTQDVDVVNKIMEKMLTSLDVEELDLIDECKVSKTYMEVMYQSEKVNKEIEEQEAKEDEDQ